MFLGVENKNTLSFASPLSPRRKSSPLYVFLKLGSTIKSFKYLGSTMGLSFLLARLTC
jgi:hypothetical protein